MARLRLPVPSSIAASSIAAVVALGSLGLASVACSAKGQDPGTNATPADAGLDTTPSDGAVSKEDADSGGFNAEAAPLDAPPATVSIVYANTDTDLWQMNPTTKAITRVGAFEGLDVAAKEDMTDIAVNAEGKVFGISVVPGAAGHIYELGIPIVGSAVKASAKRKLASTTRFYALAFAPAGVLDPKETLVAGDSDGDLYLIPDAVGGTPVNIGSFGTVSVGDPGTGATGNKWQLSGDLVFFQNGGTPVGLATVRPCAGTMCKIDNDVLIEIDMAALAAKSAKSNLKKRFIGTTGSGHGRLFGVGAWNDEVFAFQRASKAADANLISISLSTGKGTVIRDFPEIAMTGNGWSGAGVSTSAKVTIPK